MEEIQLTTVPYPQCNSLFTTQDTYGICLNMGAIGMAPT